MTAAGAANGDDRAGRHGTPDVDAPVLLREVSESEARGTVAEVYDEIRSALRSPNVNLVYRLLASQQGYFDDAWAQIGPNLASRYLEREAERIRARAALDVGAAGGLLGLELAGAVGTADLAWLRGIVDLFNYANPKNLIVVTALRDAFDGRPIPGSGDDEDGRRVPDSPLPEVEVSLPGRDALPPDVRTLLAEIVAARETGGEMPSMYRALARRPALLRVVWDAVRPFVAATEYGERVYLVRLEAERSARALPFPVSLSGADAERLVGSTAARAISATLRAFSEQMIAALTVEAHTLKALLDGQAAAASSPFAWRG